MSEFWSTTNIKPFEPLTHESLEKGLEAIRDEVSQTPRTIADHPLTRLSFSHDTERYIFSEYFVTQQNKSETLLSLRDTIEHYRTTPYDVLFKEMRQ